MPEGIFNYFVCQHLFLRVTEPEDGFCAVTFRVVALPGQCTGFLFDICNHLHWKDCTSLGDKI